MVTRQVIFQTTGAHTATPVSPDLVVANTIAAFNAATGASSAMAGASPAKYFLVQGNAEFPIQTQVITAADILSVEKQLFVAPISQRLQWTSIPVGPTGGAEFTFKIVEKTNPTERRGGSEPRYRKDYSQTVPASQTDEDTIYAFVLDINADSQRIVNAGANKIDSKTVTGASGTLLITIADGVKTVAYSTAFNTSVAITIDDFITNHAAAILANHGIVATDGTTLILLTGSVNTNGGGADWTAVDTGSATMAAATSITEATTFFLEAKAQGTQFDVFENTAVSAAVKATAVAHVEGSGSPQQVLQLEQEAQGAYSNYYRETPQPLLPATFSGSSNFDIYTVRFKTNQDGQSPVKAHQFQELVLCVVDGLSGDLDIFFGI